MTGTKWQTLEKQSKMVRMVVIPFDGGKPEMKSMETWDHGRLGMCKGWRRPEGGRWDDLFLEQTEQAKMYSLTSLCTEGHQNLWLMRAIVQLMPGCAENLDA